MNKITLLFVSLLLVTSTMQAQNLLAHWRMDFTNGNNATSVDTNITAGALSTVGTAVTSTSTTAKQFGGWSTSPTIDLNYYIEISLAPNTGYAFTVTQLNFTHNRSIPFGQTEFAPKKYEIRTSVDDFSTFTTISSGTIPDTAQLLDITGLNLPVNEGETLKIRLYAFDGTINTSIGRTRDWVFLNNAEGIKVYGMSPTLSVNKPEFAKALVYSNQNNLVINTINTPITKVLVYNVNGRVIATRKNVNASQLVISNLQTNDKVLFVTVETKNTKVTKKVLFN